MTASLGSLTDSLNYNWDCAYANGLRCSLRCPSENENNALLWYCSGQLGQDFESYRLMFKGKNVSSNTWARGRKILNRCCFNGEGVADNLWRNFTFLWGGSWKLTPVKTGTVGSFEIDRRFSSARALSVFAYQLSHLHLPKTADNLWTDRWVDRQSTKPDKCSLNTNFRLILFSVKYEIKHTQFLSLWDFILSVTQSSTLLPALIVVTIVIFS